MPVQFNIVLHEATTPTLDKMQRKGRPRSGSLVKHQCLLNSSIVVAKEGACCVWIEECINYVCHCTMSDDASPGPVNMSFAFRLHQALNFNKEQTNAIQLKLPNVSKQSRCRNQELNELNGICTAAERAEQRFISS